MTAARRPGAPKTGSCGTPSGVPQNPALGSAQGAPSKAVVRWLTRHPPEPIVANAGAAGISPCSDGPELLSVVEPALIGRQTYPTTRHIAGS